MNDRDMPEVIRRLEADMAPDDTPIVSQLAEKRRDPFEILISTLLSLRTKDEVTAGATARLFSLADTPEAMAALPAETIREAIYPVGFYRTKAQTIRDVCRDLGARFGGQVPATLEELLSLKGVGRKTANLVVSLGYDGDGLCVDTHVHRISNRLGYVRTKTPDQTEQALRAKLPRPYWQRYNTLLVSFGQRTCRPLSPLCSRCPVSLFCDRRGVVRSR